MKRLLTAILLLAALLAPTVAGHGAPSPRDQDTRLLADYNDDCGGDDSSGLQACGGAHDLIALDVREAYDASLGDVVVFRLFLNGPAAANLRDVVTFKAAGVAKTFELRTDDNVHFTGTGFESVSPGTSIGDGARFVVEATLKRSMLGDVGTKLTDYKVEAYKGNTMGDYMPGTYRNALGTPGPVPATEQSQPTKYERAEYALRGPNYYTCFFAATDTARTCLSQEPQAEVAAGGGIVQLNALNPFPTTAQTTTFAIISSSSAEARFHNAATGAQSSTMTVDLAKRGSSAIHLAIEGEAGSSGSVVLLATTNLGGRLEHTLPFHIAEGSSTSQAPNPPSPPAASSQPNGAPGPTPALALAAVALALVIGRRV